jgi:S1/P1 Nuclease
MDDFKSAFNQYNITETITAIVQWISVAEDGDYTGSYVYTYLTALYPTNENLAKSYALRLMVHYMGDVHQPLHCEDRFDAANPTGDLGGNTFTLPNHYSAANLHSVWDKLIYTQHVNIARPINQTQWDSLQV